MPALVAGIHDFAVLPRSKDVDGRTKSGHDLERDVIQLERSTLPDI